MSNQRLILFRQLSRCCFVIVVVLSVGGLAPSREWPRRSSAVASDSRGMTPAVVLRVPSSRVFLSTRDVMTVHGGAMGKGLSPLTVTTLFGVSPSSCVGIGICDFLVL